MVPDENIYLDNCPTGTVPYIIRQGDTLEKIAALYNSTVNKIISYNPEIRSTSLQIGKRICVPAAAQYYPSCPTTNYYVVQEGDTLNSIAQFFNVTVEQLLTSNYGISTNLYKDQVLCIPVAPPLVMVEVNVWNKTLDIYRNGFLFRRYTLLPINPDILIPRGTFNIISKQLDPGSPSGYRWLSLSQPGFGIRGVNTPQFIRNVATKKDLILSNKDIIQVFNLLPVGTNVRIV